MQTVLDGIYLFIFALAFEKPLEAFDAKWIMSRGSELISVFKNAVTKCALHNNWKLILKNMLCKLAWVCTRAATND